MALDELVGLLPPEAPPHELDQHGRGGQVGQVALELVGDDPGEGAEPGQDVQRRLLDALSGEEGVGQRHPPHDRAAHIALVPLVTGHRGDHGHVALEHPLEADDALAGAGIHLVGHG